MTADEFIRQNKIALIKYLQLSRDLILSTSEDQKVKKILEQIETIDCSSDDKAYNLYLEDPFGTTPF